MDAPATEPSGYHSKSKGSSVQKLGMLSLPLVACTIGLKLLESSESEQYWLHLDPISDQLLVTLGQNHTKERFPFREIVDYLEVRCPHIVFPIRVSSDHLDYKAVGGLYGTPSFSHHVHSHC